MLLLFNNAVRRVKVARAKRPVLEAVALAAALDEARFDVVARRKREDARACERAPIIGDRAAHEQGAALPVSREELRNVHAARQR